MSIPGAASGGGGIPPSDSLHGRVSETSEVSSESIAGKSESVASRIDKLKGTILSAEMGDVGPEAVLSEALELRESPLAQREVFKISSSLATVTKQIVTDEGKHLWCRRFLRELERLAQKSDYEGGKELCPRVLRFIDKHCKSLRIYSSLKEDAEKLQDGFLKEGSEDASKILCEGLVVLLRRIDEVVQGSIERAPIYDNIFLQSSQLDTIGATMPDTAMLAGVMGLRTIVEQGIPKGALKGEKLAEGSFGVAYKRKERVYKIIKDRRGPSFSKIVNRAIRETSAAFLHSEEGIASAEAMFVTQDKKVVVLSKYGGDVSFGSAFPDTGAPFRADSERVYQVAVTGLEALDRVHRAGLVHQDIKPANMRLQRDGRCTLIDFGLVVRKGEKGGAGTAIYLPPEVMLAPVCSADPSIDLWGFGVSLIESIAGRKFIDLIQESCEVPLEIRPDKIHFWEKQLLREYCVDTGYYQAYIEELLMKSISPSKAREKLIDAIFLLVSLDAKKRTGALDILRSIDPDSLAAEAQASDEVAAATVESSRTINRLARSVLQLFRK